MPPRGRTVKSTGGARPHDVAPLPQVPVDEIPNREAEVGADRPPEERGPRDGSRLALRDVRASHLGEVDGLVPVEEQSASALGSAEETLPVDPARFRGVVEPYGGVGKYSPAHARAPRRSRSVASASSRTPTEASLSDAPASRSMTTSARSTSPPAARMISTERSELPPVVETSSMRSTRSADRDLAFEGLPGPVLLRRLAEHHVREAGAEGGSDDQGNRAELHPREPVDVGHLRGEGLAQQLETPRVGPRALDVHVDVALLPRGEREIPESDRPDLQQHPHQRLSLWGPARVRHQGTFFKPTLYPTQLKAACSPSV